MMMILFAGYKGSGKTTAIAALTRSLCKLGKEVCTVKHIHGDEEFAFDEKGKDSWIQVRSGASTVIAVSKDMIYKVERFGRNRSPFEALNEALKGLSVDFVLVEGFNKELSKINVKTVICAKTESEADDLLRVHRNPLFICGELRNRMTTYHGVPVLDIVNDTEKAIRLISLS